ncbi:MAG: polysaccharide pyruvyl transferase family protein [Pseudomonadota bacterium]
MNTRPLVIGLLWHSLTSDNFGVGALTLANMAIARAAAETAGRTVSFKILGWSDPRTPYCADDDVEIIGLRARDLNPLGGTLFNEARACDVVLDIGAGDSFSDIYGPGRIAKMLLAARIIRMAGTPIIMSPQTIGPFKNGAIARAASASLRQAALVCTRDALSTACARELGFKGDIIEASDVALRLPAAPVEKPWSSRVAVGLNVSGLLFNGGYTGRNMFSLKSDYALLARRLTDYFSALDECDLWLTGHVISDDQAVEDDYRACARLVEDFPRARLAPRFADPVAAKSFIAGMDFFIGARMHACIAAFSSGVATAPTAYSRKFAGLFGALGYDEGVDCRETSTDDAFDALVSAFERRETLTRAADEARARGFARLERYENALAAFFANHMRRAA